jgi:hypothetical protein
LNADSLARRVARALVDLAAQFGRPRNEVMADLLDKSVPLL